MENLVLIIIIGQVIVLFYTSRYISSALFNLSSKVFRKESIAVMIVALIFFPGTVVHELSHYIMAKLLLVKVGEMEFTPQLHSDGIKMGSVRTAKTDMIRRFLIGAAPLIMGVLLLVLGTLYLLPFIYNFELSFTYIAIAIAYLYSVFVVTNTMFSSKKDMEGALGLGLFLGFLVSVIIVAGKGVWLIDGYQWLLSNELIREYGSTVVKLLTIPLIVNLVIIIFKNILKSLKS